MSVTYVRTSRQPVIIGILVALALISAYSLAYDPPSKTIDLAFDYPQRAIWSGQVLAASGVTLAGMFHRDRLSGLLWERVGWAMLTVGLGTYVTILLTVSSWSAAGIIVAVVLGIVVGAAGRIWQITGDLRTVRDTRTVLDA